MHQRRHREPRRALVAPHLVVDLGRRLVVGTHHRRHVGVALPPQHALRPARRAARAVHDEVVGRPGDPDVRIALRHSIVQVDGPRDVGAVAAVVDRDQQVGAQRSQHVGEFRAEGAVVDDGSRLDVIEQIGDLARRVVVVDVHWHRAGLQAADHHLGIAIVVHDQRDPVLAALPVVQAVALAVRAEPLVRQEVRQPAGAIRHLTVGGSAVTAHRHRAVRDDVGDGVDDIADGPLAMSCRDVHAKQVRGRCPA